MLSSAEKEFFTEEEIVSLIIHYLEFCSVDLAYSAAEYGLVLHPNSHDIQLKKLEVLLELGQYPEAKIIFKNLEAECGEELDFLICRAKYYSNLGNAQKSIEYCHKALVHEEEENFLHCFIADEYVNLNQHSLAKEHYHKALEFDPYDDYSFENLLHCMEVLGEHENALVFLDGFLESHPFHEASWIAKAEFLLQLGSYKKALEALEYALAINSYSLAALHKKLDCYEAIKDYASAVVVLEQLIALHPQNPQYLFQLGQQLHLLGNIHEAKSKLLKCLSLDPGHYDAHHELAMIAFHEHDYEEALHQTKAAILAGKDDNEIYIRKLNAEFKLNDLSGAEKTLSILCERWPENFYHWNAYALLLMLKKDYSHAKNVIINALKHHYYKELFTILAECYLVLGDESRAMSCLTAADKTPSAYADGQDIPVWKDLGIISDNFN